MDRGFFNTMEGIDPGQSAPWAREVTDVGKPATSTGTLSSRLRAFLYRRLAGWITCELKLLGRHPLLLDSKFQVNSLQDVFCHPFYWQIFGWLKSPPRLVVDLGAHCGHFSMLADMCFRIQFGGSEAEFLLLEPNPELVPIIERNLQRSGLCPSHLVHQALVGCAKRGFGTLWVSPHNYLSASLQRGPATRGIQVNYIDLAALVGQRRVDLLKIDIEGAEFEFVEAYPALLTRVDAVMMEIHEAPDQAVRRMRSSLQSAGLISVSEPIAHGGATLARYQRR
jgi:FkbM family methyltransferase